MSKSLLTFLEDRETFLEILEKSNEIKNNRSLDNNFCEGKNVALLFEQHSTRTRVSLQSAINNLGGSAVFLSKKDLQLGRGEPISDTAKVLSSYVDAIVARLDSHDKLIELAENSNIPVINGLTDKYHPLQALADLMTIQEVKGELKV